ncbi:MAG: hypothetical protein EAZ28_31755, partial [Oscillatoriales cyanobacterium]
MPQDFSGKNLRGRNFKGQNLTGAKFIGADIRGANFTNAILKEADFTRAKAGLQKRWTIFLVTISLFLSVISGLMLGFASAWVAFFFTPAIIKQCTILPGVVVLIVLAILFIATIRQGLAAVAAVGAVAGAVAVVVAVAVAMGGAVLGAVVGEGLALVRGVNLEVAVAGAGAVAVGGAVAGAVGMAVAVAVAGAVTGAVGMAVTGAVGMAAAEPVGIAVAEAVAAAVADGESLARIWKDVARVMVGKQAVTVRVMVGTLAVTLAALGIYVAWRALAGDKKHALIRTVAIAFATTGGTSFRNADLTDANFTEATLKSTDFRTANLTRTCFHKTEKLDRARVGKSILADTRIRELLITGNGYKKSY